MDITGDSQWVDAGRDRGRCLRARRVGQPIQADSRQVRFGLLLREPDVRRLFREGDHPQPCGSKLARNL
jgi:hypothetical protein